MKLIPTILILLLTPLMAGAWTESLDTNFVKVAQLSAMTNQFVTSSITNGLATTNYTLVTATNVAAALTNDITSGITLAQATNVAAALTNQLAIPTTNQFLTTNQQFTTISNPTNQYAISVLYTNLTGYRVLLVGTARLNLIAQQYMNGDYWAQITVFYTNNNVGYSSTIRQGENLVTYPYTEEYDTSFCVPLNTNATFRFVLTTEGLGSSGFLTNTVLWAAP
jgi:hypothetical protein